MCRLAYRVRGANATAIRPARHDRNRTIWGTNYVASFDRPFDDAIIGDLLTVEQVGRGKTDVYFLPLSRYLADSEEEDEESSRVRLLHVDVTNGLLTTFPMKNLYKLDGQVRPKYDGVERISFSGGIVAYSPGIPTAEEPKPEGRFLGSYHGRTTPLARDSSVHQPEPEETAPTSADDVAELLQGLPRYCGRQPQYGLGLKQPYRAIVHAIEDLTDATEILISHCGSTVYDEESRRFVVSREAMLDLIKSIDRVNKTTRTAANAVNQTSTYNEIADVLGLARRPMKYGRTKLRKVLTAVGNGERRLSSAERVELVETLTQNVRSILESEPATMAGLESGIAKARTRDLAENLRRMIGASCDEATWQRFLQDNPFVLSMVFGRPIVRIANQASVGGQKISGGGHKITDFLARNTLTNNAALVEIKTPKTMLLNKAPYRESVYTPAGELVGAINQALDQKSRFQQDIANIRYRNPTLSVEAYHVQAYVLAGTMPSGDDRIKSFELFRHNLKDVVVVTFDELLRKVEDLAGFLEGKDQTKDHDVPF